MARGRTITHICEHCGANIQMTSWEYFNSRHDREKLPQLRSYTLFSNFCPYCGKPIHPPTCLLYQEVDKSVIIYYIDGPEKEAKKQEVLDSIAREPLPGYTYRVVTERVVFIETVEMLLAGFEERIMRLAKWVNFLIYLDVEEERNDGRQANHIWFELDEEDTPVWHIDFPDGYQQTLEITPEQYARYVDALADVVEMHEEQICIDDEWGSAIALQIYEAMMEDGAW